MKYLQAFTSNHQAELKKRYSMVEAEAEIDNVRAALLSVRDDVDAHHSLRFHATKKNSAREWMDVEPSLPGICGYQRHCNNLPANTPTA